MLGIKAYIQMPPLLRRAQSACPDIQRSSCSIAHCPRCLRLLSAPATRTSCADSFRLHPCFNVAPLLSQHALPADAVQPGSLGCCRSGCCAGAHLALCQKSEPLLAVAVAASSLCRLPRPWALPVARHGDGHCQEQALQEGHPTACSSCWAATQRQQECVPLSVRVMGCYHRMAWLSIWGFPVVAAVRASCEHALRLLKQ